MANSPTPTEPGDGADTTTTNTLLPFVVVNNSFDPATANTTTGLLPVPTKAEDGSPYQYEMICDGGKYRVYADTLTALCEYLIPAYIGLRDQEDVSVGKTALRIKYAVGCQVKIQAQVWLDYETQYGAEPLPKERAILEAPRDVPPQLTEVWECEIPLVLVSTYYAPFTQTPQPQGQAFGVGEPGANLIWLRPEGEGTLLMSLHEAGWIMLAQRKPTPIEGATSGNIAMETPTKTQQLNLTKDDKESK